MTKIAGIDLGDQWIGVAISDISKTFARPYQTVKIEELDQFLLDFLKKEDVKEIVIGYPLTLKGTQSDQTKRVLAQSKELEEKFPEIKFVLWDERLSSKRAESVKAAKTKEEKLKSHARAAAFILDSYLVFLQTQKN